MARSGGRRPWSGRRSGRCAGWPASRRRSWQRRAPFDGTANSTAWVSVNVSIGASTRSSRVSCLLLSGRVLSRRAGQPRGQGLIEEGGQVQNQSMASFDDVCTRIESYAGQTSNTVTGLPFTYRTPGDYLKVTRDGREINRSLSHTNFRKASASMPTPASSNRPSRRPVYAPATSTAPRRTGRR